MSDTTLSEGLPKSFGDSSSEESAGPISEQALRRRGIIASRRKSPGPKCFPLRIGRRKIVFLERDRTGPSELPVVQLDYFLERHVLPRRMRSGPCPQCLRFEGRTVSLAALKIGAARGCALCVLAYFAITAFYTDTVSANMLLHKWKEFKSFKNLGIDHNLELYTVSDTLVDQWNFYGTRMPAGSVRSSFPEDVSSTQSVQFAQRQLQDCITQHRRCGDYTNGKRLPTRLIDVMTLRVCETATFDSGEILPLYTCLSHCWGPSTQANDVLRTTRATLATYKNGIVLDHLPRTFREAIQFTRALRVPYIWIDSLCIIQDDKLDWEKEAAVMADIYMNCHVTLAASVSRNSEEGLFARQGFGSIKVGSVHRSSGRTLPLYMRLLPDHFPLDACYPLAQRAWVMQETILSPRTLYFIGTEVIYECQESLHCECGDEEDLDWVTVKQHEWSTTMDWTRILSLYSKTSLSFSRDTLPALSGLAKRWLATHPDDTYLAGLWRSNLLETLLWQNDSRTATRVRPWRAPSWSWASIDTTSLRHPHPYFEKLMFLVEVIDAYCAPSGADPTGTVAFGHLILRGRAFNAQIHYGHKQDHVEWHDHDLLQAYVHLDELELACLLDFAAWDPGRHHIAQGSTVRLLVVAGPGNMSFYRHFPWQLLILKPLFGDTYERIGVILSRRLPKGDEAASVVHKLYDDAPVADYFIV